MNKKFNSITAFVKSERQKYHISNYLIIIILLFPLLIIPIFSILLALTKTREFTISILKENHIVELLTFIFLFSGSVIGFKLSRIYYSKNLKSYIWIFFALFSFGLFIVAMEEIAWGQQFFNFKTPDSIKALNAQGELTIHNIHIFQGKSEYFRLLFGISGFFGILLARFYLFKKISPPKILLPFFLVIIIVSAFDLFADYYKINENYDYGLKKLSELIEMLIGLSAVLYVMLIFKKESVKLKNNN